MLSFCRAGSQIRLPLLLIPALVLLGSFIGIHQWAAAPSQHYGSGGWGQGQPLPDNFTLPYLPADPNPEQLSAWIDQSVPSRHLPAQAKLLHLLAAQIPEHDGQSPPGADSETLQLLRRTLFPWLGRTWEARWRGLGSFRRSFRGRGIVICAAEKHLPELQTLVQSIRSLGCELPIEIFHLGSGEMPNSAKRKASGLLGVSFLDLEQLLDNSIAQISGVHLKPFALLLSSFREGILIDVDAVFLESPERLLGAPASGGYAEAVGGADAEADGGDAGAGGGAEAAVGFLKTPERRLLSAPAAGGHAEAESAERQSAPAAGGYAETGALFFRDRSVNTSEFAPQEMTRWLRSFLPRPPSPALARNPVFRGAAGEYIDSGVVILDKHRHLAGLLAACSLNAGHAKREVVRRFNGEKETFWLGLELVGGAYYLPPEPAAVIGRYIPPQAADFNETDGEPPVYEICGHMLHLDPTGGAPLWWNGGHLINRNTAVPVLFSKMNAWQQEDAESEWHFVGLGGSACMHTLKEPIMLAPEELIRISSFQALFRQNLKPYAIVR